MSTILKLKTDLQKMDSLPSSSSSSPQNITENDTIIKKGEEENEKTQRKDENLKPAVTHLNSTTDTVKKAEDVIGVYNVDNPGNQGPEERDLLARKNLHEGQRYGSRKVFSSLDKKKGPFGAVAVTKNPIDGNYIFVVPFKDEDQAEAIERIAKRHYLKKEDFENV